MNMKIKTIIGLLLVLALVLTTTLLDNNSFKIVKRSLTNIYEDRLVAYDLTYKMHEQVTNRKISLLKGEMGSLALQGEAFYNSIDETLVQYERTKLTANEKEYLNKLSDRFDDLEKLESQWVAAEKAGGDNDAVATQMMERTNKIVETLNVLAQIQVDEGRRQMILSSRAVETGDFMIRFKIVCIIIVGLAIQFMLLYKPKKR